MHGLRRLILAAAMGGSAAAAGGPPEAPAPYGFVVEVQLSAKAAAKLAAVGETVEVLAYYSGDPAPSALKHADQMNQINLGHETVEISGAGGPAVFTGRAIRRERTAWLARPDPDVDVNVQSLGHNQNRLDCEIFEGKLSLARRAPVALHCKLVGEP